VCFSKSFLNCKKAQGLARSRDDVNTQVRTLMSLNSPSSMIFLAQVGTLMGGGGN